MRPRSSLATPSTTFAAALTVADVDDYTVPYTRLVPRLRFFLDSDVRGELRLPLRGGAKRVPINVSEKIDPAQLSGELRSAILSAEF